MVISAEPLIYGLIFLAVLALVAGPLPDRLRQIDQPEQPGQPPARDAGKGRWPRTGAGTTPQGDEPAHELEVDPALRDPCRQGAESEHRLYASAA